MSLQSIYFDTATLTLGADLDVSCSVTGATFDNDTPVESRNKLCGKGKAAGEADWTLTVEYDQDWPDGMAASLSHFLIVNAGQQVAAVLEWEEGNLTVTAEVLVIAGQAGGKAGEVAEGSVELPVVGTPLFTETVPVVPDGAAAGDQDSEPAGAAA